MSTTSAGDGLRFGFHAVGISPASLKHTEAGNLPDAGKFPAEAL